jgi:hypothetical protein
VVAIAEVAKGATDAQVRLYFTDVMLEAGVGGAGYSMGGPLLIMDLVLPCFNSGIASVSCPPGATPYPGSTSCPEYFGHRLIELAVNSNRPLDLAFGYHPLSPLETSELSRRFAARVSNTPRSTSQMNNNRTNFMSVPTRERCFQIVGKLWCRS